MIKSDHGNVVLKGTRIDLMADLTILIGELTKGEAHLAKEDISACVENAYKTTGEIREETIQNLNDIISLRILESLCGSVLREVDKKDGK